MTEQPDKFTWQPGDIQWDDEGEGGEGADDEGESDLGKYLTAADLDDTPARAEKLATSPEGERGAERLRHYWAHGEGAGKIGWGTPGDFDRCVAEVGKYMKDPKGYCNLRHHEALGYYPATHAAMERGHKGAGSVDTHGYYPTDHEVLKMMIGLLEEAEQAE